MKGYERIVGLIEENKSEYGLRAGIKKVKCVAGRIHLTCPGKSIFLTLVGGHTEIKRGSIWHTEYVILLKIYYILGRLDNRGNRLHIQNLTHTMYIYI
jgi:hypothetical protein